MPPPAPIRFKTDTGKSQISGKSAVSCRGSHLQEAEQADPAAQTEAFLAQVPGSVQVVQVPGHWHAAGPGCPGPWAQCPCWLAQALLALAERLQRHPWHALLCSHSCCWHCGPLKTGSSL